MSNFDINNLRDSVSLLLIDTTLLERGLFLSDKVIKIDTIQNNELVNYSNRIQILSLLGKKKEAFLLTSKIISEDKNNIDRIFYNGVYYGLNNMNDSSLYYLNIVNNRCDSILSVSFDMNAFIKKIELLTYQKKRKESILLVDSLMIKYNKMDLDLIKKDIDIIFESEFWDF